MKEYLLLILLNLPTGGQYVNAAIPMTESDCLAAQVAIWTGPNTTAYTDHLGPANTIDAACILARDYRPFDELETDRDLYDR